VLSGFGEVQIHYCPICMAELLRRATTIGHVDDE